MVKASSFVLNQPHSLECRPFAAKGPSDVTVTQSFGQTPITGARRLNAVDPVPTGRPRHHLSRWGRSEITLQASGDGVIGLSRLQFRQGTSVNPGCSSSPTSRRRLDAELHPPHKICESRGKLRGCENAVAIAVDAALDQQIQVAGRADRRSVHDLMEARHDRISRRRQHQHRDTQVAGRLVSTGLDIQPRWASR